MTRTAVLSFAAAIGFAATLTAQSTTSTTTQQRDRMNGDKHEVTITGCLSKGADGNYMMTNASEDKAGSTTTASGATTTGTTGTTGTTASGSESQRRSTTTTDANQPKLDVTSVKMISSSCS